MALAKKYVADRAWFWIVFVMLRYIQLSVRRSVETKFANTSSQLPVVEARLYLVARLFAEIGVLHRIQHFVQPGERVLSTS